MAPRSASEYTATEAMPRSRQARATLTAISPRLAIRTLVMRRAGVTGTLGQSARLGWCPSMSVGPATTASWRGWPAPVSRPWSSWPRRRPPTRSWSTRPGRGAAEGLVVVADHQTAGRGRFDRRWESPPGHVAAVLGACCAPARSDLPARRRHLAVAAVSLAAGRGGVGCRRGRGPASSGRTT